MLCCYVITIKSNDDHLALRAGIKMRFNAHSCYKISNKKYLEHPGTLYKIRVLDPTFHLSFIRFLQSVWINFHCIDLLHVCCINFPHCMLSLVSSSFALWVIFLDFFWLNVLIYRPILRTKSVLSIRFFYSSLNTIFIDSVFVKVYQMSSSLIVAR